MIVKLIIPCDGDRRSFEYDVDFPCRLEDDDQLDVHSLLSEYQLSPDERMWLLHKLFFVKQVKFERMQNGICQTAYLGMH